jgi:uncharacterized membrane protein YgdD (TMEM256/DUF423 family)
MGTASILTVLIAALHGSSGVALAAAVAHVENSVNLATASQFLMLHAAAGIGLAALASLQIGRARWLVGVTFALQTGVTLFSLDIVCRAFLETRLFPYAAPIGGSLTIVSWLALAGWAVAELISSKKRSKVGDDVVKAHN